MKYVIVTKTRARVEVLTRSLARWGQFFVARVWLACCAGLPVLSLGACADGTSWADQYVTLRGETMGTYYALRFKQAAPCQMSVAEADTILAAVNQSMSTYLDTSELSEFNEDDSLQWRDVSSGLAEVLGVADAVHRASGGAFDVTVGPLVNAWGFGPGQQTTPPSAETQQAAAATVGMQHLEWEHNSGVTRLRKRVAGVYVDLSALAKGYAVDQLADVLRNRDCVHFMVDVGGEISVAGLNPRRVPWQIGIESPDVGQVGVVQKVMVLQDVSVATSGDYRNFRMVNGHRVDHVFDPRSAGPADNLVVSATVVHPSAMWADAWATTLMVLGAEAGLAIAEAQGLPVYLLLGSGDTPTGDEFSVQARYTEAMIPYLKQD